MHVISTIKTMKPRPHPLQYLLFSFLLIGSVWLVYAQVYHFAFVRVDDGDYVVENSHVNTGLSWANIKWAFARYHSANWHPLTWLSHMLDCQLFGLNPGVQHLTNVVIHSLNTLLLFLILARFTGYIGRSAMVAALFALHPTHVESVAWISERKDVLSTFFWILAMGAYFRYAERPRLKAYLITLLLFVFGLMSKPMVVTFPCVLWLLDFWPLNRFAVNSLPPNAPRHPTPIIRLITEKIPFLLLSVASCGVTLFVQRHAGPSLEQVSNHLRLSNTLLSYLRYIGKLVWPTHLAILYPYPDTMPGIMIIIGAIFILMVITVLALFVGKKYRYVPVGWFWYIGTLLPVIGIIQVGSQAMADRYLYIPSIGLFIIIVWGLPEWLGSSKIIHRALTAGAVAVMILLAVTTWKQVSLWQDSRTLYAHTCKVTKNNRLMLNSIAEVYQDHGQARQAITYYEASLQCSSQQPTILNNLAWLLATAEDKSLRDPQKALKYALQACEIIGNPNAIVLDTLAAADAANGHFNDAAATINEAISLAPKGNKPVYLHRLHLYQQDKPYTEPTPIDTNKCRQYGERL